MKTKLQFDKIARVIARDASTMTVYFSLTDPPKFCVIGGLLHAAGVDVPTLLGGDNRYKGLDWLRTTPQGETVFRILKKHYGISRTLAKDLQEINDTHNLTASRRRALLKALTIANANP